MNRDLRIIKNENLRRLLNLLSCLVLALSVTVSLAGCGQSEEQILESQLASELDAIKNASDENIEELLGADAVSELAAYGLDAKEIYAALFGHFDYTSKGVAISGDLATATLEVTNIDIQAATANYINNLNDWAISDEGLQLIVDGDEEALQTQAAAMLLEALNDPSLPTVTSEVTINMAKDSSNTWHIEDQNQVISALFAGADVSSLFS